MLFIVFVALLVVGIIIKSVGDYDWKDYLGLSIIIIAVFALIISLIIIGAAYIGVDGYIARCNVRYDTLVYQYENDIYDNDNDLGKRELFKDIQDWNEDLARYRELQDNFWVGIYYPNIYDQFEFVELN